MSDKDIECPYCGEEQEVNHDDGYGYEEDCRHEQECICGKYFCYTTSISCYYEANKADCLNGSDHKLKYCKSHPEFMSKRYCQDCEYEEDVYTKSEKVEMWREYEEQLKELKKC